MAEFYLGPGGSENYDFEHIQVLEITLDKFTTPCVKGIVNMYSDAWYWYTMHDWAR